jgi:Helix-turn-helix domain
MKNTRRNSKAQKKKSKLADSVSDQVKRAARGETLRRCEAIAMKVSGKACSVFLALKSQADADGYCWPLISTLQKFTEIKTRRAISRACREFERLGILDRVKLVSRKNGNRSPNLYRIGGQIENLPSEAAARFILKGRGEKQEAT